MARPGDSYEPLVARGKQHGFYLRWTYNRVQTGAAVIGVSFLDRYRLEPVKLKRSGSTRSGQINFRNSSSGMWGNSHARPGCRGRILANKTTLKGSAGLPMSSPQWSSAIRCSALNGLSNFTSPLKQNWWKIALLERPTSLHPTTTGKLFGPVISDLMPTPLSTGATTCTIIRPLFSLLHLVDTLMLKKVLLNSG